MPRNYLGVDTGARNFADLTQAALGRREFNNFLSGGYLDLLRQNLGEVDNAGYLNRRRADARSTAASQFQRGLDQRDQAIRSYGIALTPDQQSVMEKSDRINAALTDVDAFNRTTQQVRDRDWMLLTGSQAPLSAFRGQQ